MRSFVLRQLFVEVVDAVVDVLSEPFLDVVVMVVRR